MYNFKLKIRTFKKKLQNRFIVMYSGEYNTELHFLTIIQVTGK